MKLLNFLFKKKEIIEQKPQPILDEKFIGSWLQLKEPTVETGKCLLNGNVEQYRYIPCYFIKIGGLYSTHSNEYKICESFTFNCPDSRLRHNNYFLTITVHDILKKYELVANDTMIKKLDCLVQKRLDEIEEKKREEKREKIRLANTIKETLLRTSCED